MVYYLKCTECGELVDEFQLDKWPGEELREFSICLPCRPKLEREDDDGPDPK